MLAELSVASSFGELNAGCDSRQRSWSDSGGFSSSLAEKRRLSCVAVPGKSTKRIKVNVSGKSYELTHRRLNKFPKSLLARSTMRARYYDEEKDEFFFDRNRMAFEFIYHFYQSAGEFLCPEHIPMELLLKEMNFFGLLEYVCPRGRQEQVSAPGNKFQKVIWELFENPRANASARLLNILLLLLNLMSILVLFLETLPQFSVADIPPHAITAAGNSNQTKDSQFCLQSLQSESTSTTDSAKESVRAGESFYMIEAFCVGCFTLELFFRFLASPDRVHFFNSVLNVCDLVSVLPFYFILVVSSFPVSMRSVYALRVLRLSRVLRLIKLHRYSSTVQVLIRTCRECFTDFLTLGGLILTSTLLFATGGYYFEHQYDGTTFRSIPATCWWALITMTSVGYGDMVPTTIGKLQYIEAQLKGFNRMHQSSSSRVCR